MATNSEAENNYNSIEEFRCELERQKRILSAVQADQKISSETILVLNQQTVLALTQISAIQDELDEVISENIRFRLQLQQFHASTSWRITRPLRAVRELANFVKRGMHGHAIRRQGASLARALVILAISQRIFHRPLRLLARRFPKLATRLRQLVTSKSSLSMDMHFVHRLSEENLSPRAMEIYTKLKSTVGKS